MEFETFMRRRLGGDEPPSLASRLRDQRGGERENARAERRRGEAGARRALPPSVPSPAPTPLPPAVPSPVRLRREQLARWQQQRQQRRQEAASRARPPFRAGAVHHRDHYEAPPPPRRSARLRAAVPSFAPPSATFRAPVIKKLGRTPRVQTPRKIRRKSSIFSTHFFHQTNVFETKETNKIVDENDHCSTTESNVIEMKTPPQFPAILSPFITSGRGKNRHSNLPKSCERSLEQTPQFFRNQLDCEISRLQSLCDEWRIYEEATELNEDSKDLINLAIGQTQLLINKKFQQFRGLIVRCENQVTKEGEGLVTIQDLQGFWDMIYMQVENLDVRFNNLNLSKNKEWKEDYFSPRIVKSKPKIKKKTFGATKNSQALKAMIRAARQKSQKESDDTCTDSKVNGGFYALVSPVKSESHNTPNSIKKSSLRQSILRSEAEKMLSQDVNLSLIDLKKTPGKSILKTPIGNKSQTRNSTKKNVQILFPNNSSIVESPNAILNNSNKINQDDDVSVSSQLDVEVDAPSKKRKRRKPKGKLVEVENISPNPIIPVINIEPLEMSKNNRKSDTMEDSFLEMISIPSKGKRRSKLARQSAIKESNRLSTNLIHFESPNSNVYVTRSGCKRYSTNMPISLESNLSQ